jgi:uracil-DNA glycosylase family 4
VRNELQAELAQLASELRAHAEWQVETGVAGVKKRETKKPAATPAKSAPAAGTFASPQAAATPRAPVASPSREAPASVPTEATAGVASAASIASPQSAIASSTASSASPLASSASPPAAGKGKLRLVELETEVRGCQKCGLHATRTQTVFARGNPESELCFIGEGPGADEDEQGFPFVGKAGQLLDRMIIAMGYGRDDVYICNIVKCRPPNNRKPEPQEMSACTPYLREQLEILSPKVIVALGATAVNGLIGMSGGITQTRGQWKLYRGVPVMPTFHPAYLLRTPSAKREVWSDLQAVLKQLGRPVPPAGRTA